MKLNIEGSISIKNLHHTNSLIGYLHHKFEQLSSKEVIESVNESIKSKVYSTGITIDLFYPLSKRVMEKVLTTGCEEDDFNKTDIVHALVELYIRKNGLGKQYAKYVGERDKGEMIRFAAATTATIAVLNASHQIKSGKEPKPKKVSSMAWMYAETK